MNFNLSSLLSLSERSMDATSEPLMTPMLDYCAVLRLKDAIPEHIKLGDLKFHAKDHFHFMIWENRGWSLYQNVGRRLTDLEEGLLNEYFRGLGENAEATSRGDALRISVPDHIAKLVSGINEIPGCRFSPNVLQKKGDLYFLVEFTPVSNPAASKVILEFADQGEGNKIDIVYYGKQETGIPVLLRLYHDEGNTLQNFVKIRTAWHFDANIAESENRGVFQNAGVFAAKYFGESGHTIMIAKLENMNEILGDAPFSMVDPENSIVEFTFESGFMKDFYSNVIRNYSGPVFYRILVHEGGLKNHFIVENTTKDSFLRSLSKHWIMPQREKHTNIIEQVENFAEYIQPGSGS